MRGASYVTGLINADHFILYPLLITKLFQSMCVRIPAQPVQTLEVFCLTHSGQYVCNHMVGLHCRAMPMICEYMIALPLGIYATVMIAGSAAPLVK
ncbi:hypothetical protein Y032_0625g805 [Ancylostoma ceylanicum]|uniref:Uncharacterized protein n=1 Tax=Ancylostoma ceylanicum TaxID=53326 RepID=A0A016WKP3_9BILA|nr:hypothetical protein Y032_0625g805 [Ancylostoma ceylanicum]